MSEEALREDGRYEQLKVLGKGTFGFVCQVRNVATQENVAIKFLPRAEVNKYVEAEIVNHSLMRHPHVIQFREVFLTSKYICIVMEYAAAGTLHSYVRQHGRLKESVARWFFQQLAVAVDYCHRKGVANRDIKLENTLLQTVPRLPLPLLKICDFGYSKAENKSAAKSKVGTLTYMAPEVLLTINRDGKYDGKVADIWSCGVMLYVMLTGRYPFDSPNPAGVINTPQDFIVMLEHMVGCCYVIPEELGLSADCRDLLRRMLLPEPHRRISVDQILRHPWFNTNLPPEAASMNTKYLSLAPLPGVPCPNEIKQMLEVVRLTSISSSSSYGSSSSSHKGSKGSKSSRGSNGGGSNNQQQQQHVAASVVMHPSVSPTSEQQMQMQVQNQEAAALPFPELPPGQFQMPPPAPQQLQVQQQVQQQQQQQPVFMQPGLHACQPAADGLMQQVQPMQAIQQQQHLQQQVPGFAAAPAGTTLTMVDAVTLSDQLSSCNQGVSSQLQAYMKASEQGWN